MRRLILASLASLALIGGLLPLTLATPAVATVIDTRDIEGSCNVRDVALACQPQGGTTPTQTSIVEGESMRFDHYSLAQPNLIDCQYGPCDVGGGIFTVSGVVDSIGDCAYSASGDDLIPGGWTGLFETWSGVSSADNGLTVRVLGISSEIVGGAVDGDRVSVARYSTRLEAPRGSSGKHLCIMTGAYTAVDTLGSDWELHQTAVSEPRLVSISDISTTVNPSVFITPSSVSLEDFTYRSTYEVLAFIGNPLIPRSDAQLVNRSLSIGFADELDDDGTATCAWETHVNLADAGEADYEYGWWIERRSDMGRYICVQQYVSYLSPSFGISESDSVYDGPRFIERWSPVSHLYINGTDVTGNRDFAALHSQTLLEQLTALTRTPCYRYLTRCSASQFGALVRGLGSIEGGLSEKGALPSGGKNSKAPADESAYAATQQRLFDRLAATHRRIESSGVLSRYGKRVQWSPSAITALARASSWNPAAIALRPEGIPDANGLSMRTLADTEVKSGVSPKFEVSVAGPSNNGTATAHVYAISKGGVNLVARKSTRIKNGEGSIVVPSYRLTSSKKSKGSSTSNYLVVTTFQPANKRQPGVASAKPLRVVQ